MSDHDHDSLDLVVPNITYQDKYCTSDMRSSSCPLHLSFPSHLESRHLTGRACTSRRMPPIPSETRLESITIRRNAASAPSSGRPRLTSDASLLHYRSRDVSRLESLEPPLRVGGLIFYACTCIEMRKSNARSRMRRSRSWLLTATRQHQASSPIRSILDAGDGQTAMSHTSCGAGLHTTQQPTIICILIMHT